MASIKLGDLNVAYRQSGRGRDLVMLHSLLTDTGVFRLVEPELSKSRRVTLIDLPGYGNSTQIVAGSIDDYADHVAAVMAALGLTSETDVFGNGFGAFVAVALAVRHGAKFDRVVVADVLPAFPPPAKEPLRGMAKRVEAEGMGAVLDIAIARMFPPAFVAAHPEVIAERKAALAGADAACFARACRALAALDFAPVLSKIGNRTLVTAGELDQTTPASGAAELAAAISGAQFTPIANCGHCPMLEQPQALVGMLEDFLA